MKAAIYSVFTIVLLAFLASCTTDSATAEDKEKPTAVDPNIKNTKLPRELALKIDDMKKNPNNFNRNSLSINQIANFYIKSDQPKKAIDILKTGLVFHSKGNTTQSNLSTLIETLKGSPKYKQDYINLIQSLQSGRSTFKDLAKYTKDIPSAEASVESKIEEIQKNLTVTSTGRLDLQKVNEFVNIVEYFVIANPTNEKSPVYLKLAAEVVNSLKVYPRAIQFYDWILSQYPNSPQAPQALFMKGFTLDDGMNKKNAARPIYEEFLKKYPKNDFADDTQFLLENINKSDEEIIKQFDTKKK